MLVRASVLGIALLLCVVFFAGAGMTASISMVISLIFDFEHCGVATDGTRTSLVTWGIVAAFILIPNLITYVLVASIWRHWYEWDLFGLGPISSLVLTIGSYACGMAAPLWIYLIT